MADAPAALRHHRSSSGRTREAYPVAVPRFHDLGQVGTTNGPSKPAIAPAAASRGGGLHARVAEQVLEHRIGLIATAGDTLVVERGNRAFETHLASLLGIAPLDAVTLGPPRAGSSVSLPMRLRGNPKPMSLISAKARDAGGCQVLPHIGTGAPWLLAGDLPRRARVPAFVAVPPPRLTRCANDKIWFAELVRSVLEPEALPATFAAFGPAAIASRLVGLARTARKVVV